jgi:hypothetical protein
VNDIWASRDHFVYHFRDHYGLALAPTTPESPLPACWSATLDFIGSFGVARPALTTSQNGLNRFFALQPEPFEDCNPIQWWAGRRTEFLNLSRFACDVFSIPGKALNLTSCTAG